ncbi:hypothetical protein DFH08DRAFT_455428 [Mycena albidolilacea]|uniref:Uncharacterized protein n=1 Tax=Mycena albidolilacea TaxID=1033008 RepID=A0AAD6Z7L1_9AGAR|nr:hypothetical protein DFH08DRAFT_455428 [Mycena albidolilacea]
MRRAPHAVSAYLAALSPESAAARSSPLLRFASSARVCDSVPVLAAPRLVLRHLVHRGLIQSRHTSRSHRTSSHAFSRRPALATKRSTASMGTTRHHRPYRPCTAFVLLRCISRTACGARDLDSGADAETAIVGAHHRPRAECQTGYIRCRDARAVHALQGGVHMEWTRWKEREGDVYILHAAG